MKKPKRINTLLESFNL